MNLPCPDCQERFRTPGGLGSHRRKHRREAREAGLLVLPDGTVKRYRVVKGAIEIQELVK